MSIIKLLDALGITVPYNLEYASKVQILIILATRNQILHTLSKHDVLFN